MNRVLLFLLPIILLSPIEAIAGGFFLPFRGVYGMGRAGATVASTRDPSAVSENPALLALIDGTHFLLDAAYAKLTLEFRRADAVNRNGTTRSFDPVNNLSPGIAIPQFYFSTDFGTDSLSLGAGVFPPYAAPVHYPRHGTQRYAIIDMSQTVILTQALAFAYRPIASLSLGAGIQNVTAVMDGAGISSTYFGVYGEAEDENLDSFVKARAIDAFTPSANFGIWYSPIEGLEFAASFQLFAKIKTKNGKFKGTLPSHFIFDPASIDSDKMDLRMNLPWHLKFGARYAYKAIFDVEIDFLFSAWAMHDKISILSHGNTILNAPLVNNPPIDNFDLPRDMKNTFAVSIASDWNLHRYVTLRAGFVFETGATKDKMYSVFQYDSEKFAPTLGLSVHLPHTRLDFGYTHVFNMPKNIKNSTYKQYNLVAPELASVTANGKYSSFYDFVGLGVHVFL